MKNGRRATENGRLVARLMCVCIDQGKGKQRTEGKRGGQALDDDGTIVREVCHWANTLKSLRRCGPRVFIVDLK